MIRSISLQHYKNYSDVTVNFEPGLNFLVGQNGMGKTNLLDAVHYLCMAKSHSTPLDRDTVQFEKPFFRLEASVMLKGHDHDVTVKVKPGEIKEILRDGQVITRMSDYIGFIPVIMLAPEDIVLIQGGGTARRRFMDVVLCQASKEYLESLQRYNKLLAQRNALLRTDGVRADRNLLMTYTTSMQDAATFICQERDRLVKALVPDIINYYNILCASREIPSLQYHSHLLDQNLHVLAVASIEADLQNARTTKGVHRDEISILLNDYAVKRFGSQGQIKSLLIAMHLAQRQYLRHVTGITPILLLDDIFDRLDEQRAQHLIMLLANDLSSQVFISDASPARVQRLLEQTGVSGHLLEIAHGNVVRPQANVRGKKKK